IAFHFLLIFTHLNFFFIMLCYLYSFFFFFFNDTATTEIYTLSLHDALPILDENQFTVMGLFRKKPNRGTLIKNRRALEIAAKHRSEEHTSELQSQSNLVCRLLLEKKKKKKKKNKKKK